MTEYFEFYGKLIQERQNERLIICHVYNNCDDGLFRGHEV